MTPQRLHINSPSPSHPSSFQTPSDIFLTPRLVSTLGVSLHNPISSNHDAPRQLFLILIATPFFFVLYFSLLVESDTLTSPTTSSGIHPVSGLSYGGTPGRGVGCMDDNSEMGCCSNGQDFQSCFSACNGDGRCENWCRSNCWNYWVTGSGGPEYRNGNGNGNGIGGRWIGSGGYDLVYGGGGGGGSPPGRNPEWQYPCSSGSRWSIDLLVVFLLAVLPLCRLFHEAWADVATGS